MTSLAYTAFRGDAISTDLDIDGLVKVLTSDEEAAKNILVTLGYVSYQIRWEEVDHFLFHFRQVLHLWHGFSSHSLENQLRKELEKRRRKGG